MRVIHAILLSSLLVPLVADAAKPEFWKIRSADEWLAGESEGLAVGARGQLLPGPSLNRIARLEDPFVLSQTSDRSGRRFIGTGNEGKVYRIDGEAQKLLYTAPESEVYAIALHGNSLLVGTSPYGKIYRVDPDSGSASVFFDPEETYIWSLVSMPDGSVVAGTGTEGRIWKISAWGEGAVLFDAPEAHIRSIAQANGRLIAGGAGEGRIYEIDPSGKGRALFDSNLTEISSIWIDTDGTGWAAAVSSVLPPAAPPKPEPAKQPPAPQDPAAPAAAPPPPPPPVVTAEVSFSFEQPGTGAAGGSSELYRIENDGFVQSVRKFEREMIYALAGAPDGSLLIGTGPLGRIYRLRDGELALLTSLPEKQVVSLRSEGTDLVATTTNAGAVYRLTGGNAGAIEYRSTVKDAGRYSRFGQFILEGKRTDGVKSYFRSGNTSSPDSTWSDWVLSSDPRRTISAPPARYLQWKLTADSLPADFVIDSMSAAYLNRNVAPVVENLTVAEPGVVFVSGAFPSSPQVLEATNPDEYGIFSSLDNPANRNEQGKRLFRKGYRTISWKASDPNGDPLRSSVYFRAKGTTPWLRLRENLEENQLNFDTSQLPDGIYEVRVVVTDEMENPEEPLTATREGVEFTVDNTPPVIRTTRQGGEIVVVVEDAASPLIRAEYAIDAEKWNRVSPVDGMTDSLREEFRFQSSEVEGRFAMIRVVDSSWNVATATIAP
ncbi:MAG TPA: hypothetical protein VM557_09680 [Thermoanaerobaculia bacterium]|nr:hypothetical protein [Thermoanaerobaculia bacterium]